MRWVLLAGMMMVMMLRKAACVVSLVALGVRSSGAVLTRLVSMLRRVSWRELLVYIDLLDGEKINAMNGWSVRWCK